MPNAEWTSLSITSAGLASDWKAGTLMIHVRPSRLKYHNFR